MYEITDIMPTIEPRTARRLADFTLMNSRGNAAKARASMSAAKQSAVTKRERETVFEAPENVARLPKSLKKLYQKE